MRYRAARVACHGPSRPSAFSEATRLLALSVTLAILSAQWTYPVHCPSFMRTGIGSTATLVYVDQSQRTHPAWQWKSPGLSWVVPSRDGRRFAIMQMTFRSNMWMIEDF